MYKKQANYLVEIIEEKIFKQDHVQSQTLIYNKNNKSSSKYFINVLKTTSTSISIQEFFTFENNTTILKNKWCLKHYKNWKITSEKFNPFSYFKTKKALKNLTENIIFLLDDNAFKRQEKFKEIERRAKNIKQENQITEKNNFYTSNNFILFVLTLLTIASIGFVFLLNIHKESTKLAAIAREIEIDYTKKEIANLSKIQDLKTKLFYTINDYNNSIEYNKEMAYFSVLRMAEQMEDDSPSRKQVYEMIAENIKEAVSFPEITYEFSRLPNHEFQARNFLFLNRGHLNKPLSFYSLVIPDMSYPVKLENREADGKGFRLTSAFQPERVDPLGTGEIKPHLAVDIINVSNIAYVNESGYIIRDSEKPGNIVSVEDGVVLASYWTEIFGWCTEIEHPVTDGLKEAFPEAYKWTSFYAHMKDKSNLKAGGAIKKGQIIGQIGSTGKSTGPHLHFELHIYHKNGQYYNNKARFDKINPLKEIISD